MNLDTTNIQVPQADLEMQMKLLYCEYGWVVPKIAATLSCPESAVRLMIDQNKWIQKDLPATTDMAANDVLATIKSGEISKQQELAPFLAVIEVTLLNKVLEAARAVDDPATLKVVIDSFKKLTQDAVINTIVENEKNGGGTAPTLAVQIINNFE